QPVIRPQLLLLLDTPPRLRIARGEPHQLQPGYALDQRRMENSRRSAIPDDGCLPAFHLGFPRKAPLRCGGRRSSAFRGVFVNAVVGDASTGASLRIMSR